MKETNKKMRIRNKKESQKKCFEMCSEKSFDLGGLSQDKKFSVLRICIELIE